MKITLKDTATLKTDAASGVTGNKIDDRLENFFNMYGGKEIQANDIHIRYIDKDTQKLTFDFFPKNDLYTSWKIPESWIDSYELEDNSDLHFCKFCNYTFKPSQLYPFRTEKDVTRDDNNTTDITDDTFSDIKDKTFHWMIENEEDLICPGCFKKNSFVKIKS